MVPVFKNFGEVNGYKLPPVSLWFVKSIEKPINNRPLDHLGICGFQYGFRST